MRKAGIFLLVLMAFMCSVAFADVASKPASMDANISDDAAVPVNNPDAWKPAVRIALPVSMIVAIGVIMAIIGRKDGVAFLSGYVSTYISAFCSTEAVHRFMPGVYDMLESVCAYFAANLGTGMAYRYEVSAWNSVMNMFMAISALHFIMRSKKKLLALLLFPVILVIQIFVVMFTFPMVAAAMKWMLHRIAYVVAGLFVLSVIASKIRMAVTYNPSCPFAPRSWPKGMKPDLRGVYVRDGKRYRYFSDAFHIGIKTITVIDDDGNTIKLTVDKHGRLRDMSNNTYDYYPPGY